MLGSNVIDAADIVAKKENVLERLSKRNKDRQNFLEEKLELRNSENVKLEGKDYFAQAFAERVCEIEKRIQHIKEMAAAEKTAVVAPSTTLAHSFADITVDIQELQRYLTSSTMFLTDYKIKACQNILNELTNSCEETRLIVMPKRKFGFHGKKVAPKTIVNPKLNVVDKVDNATKPSSGAANTAFSWTLSNRNYEHICLSCDEVNGKDITISNLTNCFVELQGHAGSVQISKAVDCIFLCGPIARSLFAEYCQNSTFALACQQLRLHSSIACRIYLHVTCRAIIEDCKKIEVSNYNYDYDTIESDYLKAGLDKTHNNYTDVADFNWLSPDIPSPNWKLLNDCNEPDWNELRSKFKEKLQS